jgi:putative two-component system response regulator
MAYKILVVDDVVENRKLLATVINKSSDYEVMTAGSGVDVVNMAEQFSNEPPDLILLDIMMPDMDGYDVARFMKSNPALSHIPIIFITGINETEEKIKAFQVGGVDYITKPFDSFELMARVNSQIKLKALHDQLKEKNSVLEHEERLLKHLVEEKTEQIEAMTITMVSALENVNLLNDTDTGNHIKRVSEYSAAIAEGFGCDNEFVKKIRIYASLHDVGKVGISDSILKKPGKYTDEEFQLMKEHVIVGAKMVDNPVVDSMARNIVRYHHEKWDGSGYMEGLKGEDIPLEARIVAIADVYDALTTSRPYKEAFSDEKARSIIVESSGTHFDPALVDVFEKKQKEFLEIKKIFE